MPGHRVSTKFLRLALMNEDPAVGHGACPRAQSPPALEPHACSCISAASQSEQPITWPCSAQKPGAVHPPPAPKPAPKVGPGNISSSNRGYPSTHQDTKPQLGGDLLSQNGLCRCPTARTKCPKHGVAPTWCQAPSSPLCCPAPGQPQRPRLLTHSSAAPTISSKQKISPSFLSKIPNNSL